MWKHLRNRLLYDPDPEGKGTGGGGKEPEKKEPEKKESEKKAELDDTLIPYKMPDGEIINLTAEQSIQAAQYGLIKMKEERSKKGKKEDKKEEDTVEEDEVVTLRKEVDQLKRERKQERDIGEINYQLFNLEQSHKETKENPRLAKKISELTLARVNINPSLSMKTVYKEELKDYLDMVPKAKTQEEKTSDLIRRSMIQTVRGGSAPIVDTEEKFGAKDIRSGKSRKAMLAWAEKAQNGE